jgi:hypothetical protein
VVGPERRLAAADYGFAEATAHARNLGRNRNETAELELPEPRRAAFSFQRSAFSPELSALSCAALIGDLVRHVDRTARPLA